MIWHVPALVLLNSDCKCLALQALLLIFSTAKYDIPEPTFVFRFHFVSVVDLTLKPVYGGWRIARTYALREASQSKAFGIGQERREIIGIGWNFSNRASQKAVLINSLNQLDFCMNPASVDFMIRSFVSLTDLSIFLILPDSHTIQVCNKPLVLRFTHLRLKEVDNILWWGNSPCYLYILWMDCMALN